MKIINTLLLLFLAFVVTNCYFDNSEDLYQYVQEVDCSSVTTATYQTDIVPLLTAHCYRCHRNDRQDGNVNLQGYAQLQVYVKDGSLFGTTNHEAGWLVMPTNGVKIPACEIEQLRLWIEKGALNN